MSNDEPLKPQSQLLRQLVPRPFGWAVRLLVITTLLLFLIGGPVEQLLFGWLYYLIRVVPKTSADWPSALLGVCSVIAFVVGLHSTLIWFLKQKPEARTVPVTWKLRSTIIIATTLILMFAAGTSMVGATHQFIWWLSSSEPAAGDEEARAQLRIPALSYGIQAARDAANRTQTRNNLKMLGLGVQSFTGVSGALPPGGVVLADGTQMHGWAIFLSAYASYFDYGKTDYTVPWNRPPNDTLFKCMLLDFYSPCHQGPIFDTDGYGLSPFAANVHVFPIRTVGPISPNHPNDGRSWIHQLQQQGQLVRLSDITDGTSNTIMLGTVVDKLKPWAHPANVRDPALGINRSPDGFGGPSQWHGGMFMMCDGSVKFLNEKIDPAVMKALGTPASGDSIPRETLLEN